MSKNYFSILVHFFNSSKINDKHENWQGKECKMSMREFLNYTETFDMPSTRELAINEYQPNLPWADLHFQERISEKPLNPPPSHVQWCKNNKTEDFLSKKDKNKFSHTYPERYWPKSLFPKGLRYPNSDLNDLKALLKKDLFTRQAYLPIFYSEDITAALENERVPCTLGYYFYVTCFEDDKFILNVNYIIRSCDVVRHLNNDLYLTWLLADNIKEYLKSSLNIDISLGKLFFNCFNLHSFKNDDYTIIKRINNEKI